MGSIATRYYPDWLQNIPSELADFGVSMLASRWSFGSGRWWIPYQFLLERTPTWIWASPLGQ